MERNNFIITRLGHRKMQKRNEKRNNYLRNVAYTMICMIISVVVGTVLMIAVYSLPVSRIRENARSSFEIYDLEGEYYRWAPDYEISQQDNFTDALMINNAVFLGRESVIYDAMTNPYMQYDDLTSQTEAAKRAAWQDTLEGNVWDYARYWHGYLIWLKPMLIFFTISDIRIINVYIQLILLLGVILELYKTGGIKSTIPFTLAVLTINPVSAALCMQHSCVYYIILISVYIMLKFRTYRLQGYWKLFLGIGIATAFFDFLTYPIAGLGLPLGLMLGLQKESFVPQIKKLICASFTWVIGYGGMWIGKWLAASILTGHNVFMEGMGSVNYRTSGQISKSILYNCAKLYNVPMLLLLAAGIICIIVLLLLEKYQFKLSVTNSAGMIILSLYPFIWYSMARNHSTVHSFMTYRNLSITVFAVSYVIINSVVAIKEKKL